MFPFIYLLLIFWSFKIWNTEKSISKRAGINPYDSKPNLNFIKLILSTFADKGFLMLIVVIDKPRIGLFSRLFCQYLWNQAFFAMKPPPPIIEFWIFGVKLQNLTPKTSKYYSIRKHATSWYILSGDIARLSLEAVCPDFLLGYKLT